MTRRGMQMTFLSTSIAALLALSTGGMAMGLPDGQVRMSNIHAPSAAGFAVYDSYGEKVGNILGVSSDQQGRARWIDVSLSDGGQARIASFRAFIDVRKKSVDVMLSKDLLVARAGGEPEDTPGEPIAALPPDVGLTG